MSLQPLLASAAIYMRAGLAKSTLKQYDHAWLHFTSFCSTYHVCAMPISISVLSAFLVHCVEGRNLQAASVSGLLAGIQFHACCLDPSSTSLAGNPSIRLQEAQTASRSSDPKAKINGSPSPLLFCTVSSHALGKGVSGLIQTQCSKCFFSQLFMVS